MPRRLRRPTEDEERASKAKRSNEQRSETEPAATGQNDWRTLQQSLGNAVTGRLFEATRREAEAEPVLPVSPAFEAAIEAEEGRGQPLPAGLRQEMEGRLDADLGDVVVHEGERAAELADAIGAHAFTQGSDVFLGAEPQPDTLAHELAHVAEQRTAEAGVLRQEAPTEIEEGGETEAPEQLSALQALWNETVVRPLTEAEDSLGQKEPDFQFALDRVVQALGGLRAVQKSSMGQGDMAAGLNNLQNMLEAAWGSLETLAAENPIERAGMFLGPSIVLARVIGSGMD